MTTSLENANIGEIWKGPDDTVWQVSSVNSNNKPSIVFLERPAKDLDAVPVDTAISSVEQGWKMILAPECEED